MDIFWAHSMHRKTFVHFIGFAVPAPKTIKLIAEIFRKHLLEHPTARFVDAGAGTGVFCWLLQRAGFGADRLIAVDLPKGTHPFGPEYWPIIRDVAYTPSPEDLVFIGWGNDIQIRSRYIEAGGCKVVILGEKKGGATVSFDALADKEGWQMTEVHEVTASFNTMIPDYLSVSERIPPLLINTEKMVGTGFHESPPKENTLIFFADFTQSNHEAF